MVRRGFTRGFKSGGRARFEFETLFGASRSGGWDIPRRIQMLSSPKGRLSSREPRDFVISRSHSYEELAHFRGGAFENRRNRQARAKYRVDHAPARRTAYCAGSRTGEPMATHDRPIFLFFTSLDIRSTVGSPASLTRANAISDVPSPLPVLCRAGACDGDARRRAGEAGRIFLWRRARLYFGGSD